MRACLLVLFPALCGHGSRLARYRSWRQLYHLVMKTRVSGRGGARRGSRGVSSGRCMYANDEDRRLIRPIKSRQESRYWLGQAMVRPATHRHAAPSKDRIPLHLWRYCCRDDVFAHCCNNMFTAPSINSLGNRFAGRSAGGFPA